MTAATLHPAEVRYRQRIQQIDHDRDQTRAEREAAMRAEVAAGKSYRQVAAEFDCSHQWVQRVVRGS